MPLHNTKQPTNVILSFGSNIGSNIFKKTSIIKRSILLLSRFNVNVLRVSQFYKNPPLLPSYLGQKQKDKISKMYFVNLWGTCTSNLHHLHSPN